jgi:HK97 gp10 family phage protein
VSGLVTIKVSGLDALQQQLIEIGVELGVKALAQAARKAFKPVLDAAKSLVPTDSAALRDSIKLSVKKPGSGDSVVVVGIRIGSGPKGSKDLPPARRWHFVEFGTAHMAAHPFLRPAFDQNQSRVLEDLKTELVKSIQRAIAKKAKSG